MVKAVPEFEYNFDKVQIEVRAASDPFAGKSDEEAKESEDPNRKRSHTTIWTIFMWITLALFLLFFILFVTVLVIYLLRQSKKEEGHRELVRRSTVQTDSLN